MYMLYLVYFSIGEMTQRLSSAFVDATLTYELKDENGQDLSSWEKTKMCQKLVLNIDDGNNTHSHLLESSSVFTPDSRIFIRGMK